MLHVNYDFYYILYPHSRVHFAIEENNHCSKSIIDENAKTLILTINNSLCKLFLSDIYLGKVCIETMQCTQFDWHVNQGNDKLETFF